MHKPVHPLLASSIGCGIGLVLSVPIFMLYAFLTRSEYQGDGTGLGGAMYGVSLGLRYGFIVAPACAVTGAVIGAIYGLVKRFQGSREEEPWFRLDDPPPPEEVADRRLHEL